MRFVIFVGAALGAMACNDDRGTTKPPPATSVPTAIPTPAPTKERPEPPPPAEREDLPNPDQRAKTLQEQRDAMVTRMTDMGVLTANGDKIYQYMNFDQIEDFKEVADTVSI